jgi:hypothetical protein
VSRGYSLPHPPASFSQNRMRGKTAIIARELDELGRVLINRPAKLLSRLTIRGRSECSCPSAKFETDKPLTEEIVMLRDVFEDTLRAMNLSDRTDPVTTLVANKIIELASRRVGVRRRPSKRLPNPLQRSLIGDPIRPSTVVSWGSK